MLSGEYAVLSGAPSIMLSVDRYVNIDVSLSGITAALRHDERQNQALYSLECPGFSQEIYRLEYHARRGFYSDNSALNFVLALLNPLLEQHALCSVMSEQIWGMRIDSSELFYLDGQGQNQKLGLGSSAALLVALDKVLTLMAAQNSPFVNESLELKWARLQNVHSVAQGKLGSGADIAASLAASFSEETQGAAGTHLFQHTKHSGGKHVACSLKALSLPEGLHIAFVWSGASASTPKYLNALFEWKTQCPETYEKHMQALLQASERLSVSVEQNADEFISTLAHFTRVLHDFAEASGLAIFAHGHEALWQSTRGEEGVVYKPCGAGGGDLGIVLSSSVERLDVFLGTLKQHSGESLQINIIGSNNTKLS